MRHASFLPFISLTAIALATSGCRATGRASDLASVAPATSDCQARQAVGDPVEWLKAIKDQATLLEMF